MQKVKLISAIVIIGFVLSVIFHYILSSYLGFNFYPNNTFLFNPNDKFNDFFNIYNASTELNPYSEPVSVYFPFTYILMFIHTLMNKWVAFTLFTGIFIASLFYVVFNSIPSLVKAEKYFYSFVLIFMSYPILFVIDRGNVEIWLFLSLLMFVNFYAKEKIILSILFLSIAISMKLYPAVFGLIFLFDKKYKEIFYTSITTISITLISMVFLKGGVFNSINGLTKCLAEFNRSYIHDLHGIQHNISLFAPLKFVFYQLAKKYSSIASLENIFNTGYFILAILIFGIVSFFLFKYKHQYSNKISLLLLSSLVLPQISFDYKLINLYIPLLLFIKKDEKSKYDFPYSILYGMLLIPKDYLFIEKDISIAIFFNPILILILMGIMIYESSIYSKTIDFRNE